MADTSFVVEATPETFDSLVLENSRKGPVLVNYWSPRAGPCMMLLPRLVKLTADYSGRYLLVLVNTDEHPGLARKYGVTSILTVKVFRYRDIVETVHGAECDDTFRRLIDRHITRPSDSVHAAALETYRAGNLERAFAMLGEAAAADPGNLRIRVDHAKLLLLNRRYPEAQALLQSLDTQEDPEVKNLSAHIAFIRAAEAAPPLAVVMNTIADNPDDLEARYRASALKLMQDDYGGAMEQLIEIVRHDRAFRNNIARKGLLAIFNLLGNKGDLVERYRALMLQAVR